MDTTVILAQPRVSRLRAEAVYVDDRGSTGLHRANARSWICFCPFGATTPLIHGFLLGKQCAFIPYTCERFGSSDPLFSTVQIITYYNLLSRFPMLMVTPSMDLNRQIFRTFPHFYGSGNNFQWGFNKLCTFRVRNKCALIADPK